MKLLVLGASGGVGRWLTRFAVEGGHEVTAVVRPTTTFDAPVIGETDVVVCPDGDCTAHIEIESLELVPTPPNRLAGHLHVSWRGDVFICCLDYEQKSVFGNIAESTVEEILGGERARRCRRQVYGLEPAAPGLLCRSCCHIRAPLARVAHA